MKSFDAMVDDFVVQETSKALPYVLREHEITRLRMTYMAGLTAGIKHCTDAFEPMEESDL